MVNLGVSRIWGIASNSINYNSINYFTHYDSSKHDTWQNMPPATTGKYPSDIPQCSDIPQFSKLWRIIKMEAIVYLKQTFEVECVYHLTINWNIQLGRKL